MNERTHNLFRGLMLVVVVLLGLNLVGVIDLNGFQVAGLVSLNTVLFIRLTSSNRRSSTGGR